jgi:hypothetical protein
MTSKYFSGNNNNNKSALLPKQEDTVANQNKKRRLEEEITLEKDEESNISFGSESDDEEFGISSSSIQQPVKKQKTVLIDDELCAKFRDKVNEALEKTAKELGLTCIKIVGSLSFSDSIINGKITGIAQVFNENGKELSAGQVQWNKSCYKYGLVPQHCGRQFRFSPTTKFYAGQIGKFVSIEKSNKKYPIIVEIGSTRVKMDPTSALSYLQNPNI